MVAIIIILLLLPSFASAELVTNWYSSTAILEYGIDADTIAGGTAAGQILAFESTPAQFQEVTGHSLQESISNMVSSYQEFALHDADSFNSYMINLQYLGVMPENVSEAELLKKWLIHSRFGDAPLNLENIYTNLSPSVQKAIFGSASSNLVSSNASSASASCLPVDMLTSVPADWADVADANQLPDFSLSHIAPGIPFLGSPTALFYDVDADACASSLTEMLQSDKHSSDFFVSLGSLMAIFSDELSYGIQNCRTYSAAFCMIAYWVFLIVWLVKNVPSVIDEVSALIRAGRS